MNTKEDIKEYYEKSKTNQIRLAENLIQALQHFCDGDNISIHSITFRIKDFDSYFEKIERKGYENPTEQIEDFCGIRIVCFYPNDLDRISNIINSEFEILESIDKTANLEADRFGYRSHHYIVKIKENWCKAPNYRGLEDLKAEIQVRTILMHSWADIEHKLAYKKKEDIPLEFRRKLYQLSALLEIADSQFQELKNAKENFKSSLIIDNEGEKEFDINKEMSLDSLQAYLDFNFPDRSKIDVNLLLNDLNKSNITFDLIDANYKKIKKILPEIEKEIVHNGKWAQVGIVRAILDLTNDGFWLNRPIGLKNGNWGEVIEKWREKLGITSFSQKWD